MNKQITPIESFREETHGWPWLHVALVFFTMLNTGLLLTLLAAGFARTHESATNPTAIAAAPLFLSVDREFPMFVYVAESLPAPDYKNHPAKAVKLNNPGNVKRNPKTVWAGAAAVQKDRTICTFDSPEYGIRAIGKILVNYQKKYKCDTIRKIVTRYAPAHENDTERYIAFVSRKLGIKPDKAFNVRQHLTPLVKAIIAYETGASITYPQEAYILLAEEDN